jgi:hypothetical protein
MSATIRSKLLCHECGELKQVSSVNSLIELACGHSRPELLPGKGISVEHLNSRLGKKWFPAVIDDEKTSLPIRWD